MRTYISILFTFLSLVVLSQKKADDIVGRYMTANNEGMIEIYKVDTKYFGKLIWNKMEGKLDENNPDIKERSKPVRGKELLKNFVFNGTDTWKDGTIYDPKNGKIYDCKITCDEKGNANVRGFVGVSMLGRTTFWIKVK